VKIPIPPFSKTACDDATVKFVFDHIRNLGLCAAVGAAAQWKYQHLPGGSFRHPELAVVVFLGLLATWLFLMNMTHGLERLRASGVSRKALSFGALFYSTAAVSIIFSILRLP